MASVSSICLTHSLGSWDFILFEKTILVVDKKFVLFSATQLRKRVREIQIFAPVGLEGNGVHYWADFLFFFFFVFVFPGVFSKWQEWLRVEG